MSSSLHADAYKALVRLLVETRTGAGVTRVELGKRLSKPQSYISKVERGERRVDLIEFTAWIEAVGAQPLDLYQTLLARLSAHSKSA